MQIYMSGLESGPNPVSGVGICRSIREAFPNATIIGVDYSNRSSGIHWPEFDEIWLQRPWSELDLELHKERILSILDSGAYWISATDLETLWLSTVIGEHPNLLIPPCGATARTSKPDIFAHQLLPVKVPAFTNLEIPDWDIDTFCRRNAWKLWAKGPYHGAYFVRNMRQLEHARKAYADALNTSNMFVQAHVAGYEESIALCAYQGELIDAVWMTKRVLTGEGKAWSGHIERVPASFLSHLEHAIQALNWTGGAELEMVRDVDGQLWMIDWNPRFPAWIHGASISGHNLPAKLIQRASGMPMVHVPASSNEFTRVVYEVPVRSDYPLPAAPEPVDWTLSGSGKGALDTATLIEKLESGPQHAGDGRAANHLPPHIPEVTLSDLQTIDLADRHTPDRLFLEGTARSLFSQVVELKKCFDTSPIDVNVAYSVKTNPDGRMLELAREYGCLAEAISQKEVERALAAGFRSNEIVLNGPAKWWPPGPSYMPLKAVFSDSLEELRMLIANEVVSPGTIFGCRLRPVTVRSRFGIPVDDFQSFQDLVGLIRMIPNEQPLGIHVHMASSFIGVDSWWNLIESVLEWGHAIESASGKRIECLDLGGGWFPDDWQASLTPRLSRIVESASAALPDLNKILLEPGKALAQPSMALAVRIIDIRCSSEGSRDVVVDGSIAEMPDMHGYPHRTLFMDKATGNWTPAARGNDRLLGRLCMEEDILGSNLYLPADIAPGDMIVFGDAGAYDRSMSYVFGQG